MDDVEKLWKLLDCFHKAQGLPTGFGNIKRKIMGELQVVEASLAANVEAPRPSPQSHAQSRRFDG